MTFSVFVGVVLLTAWYVVMWFLSSDRFDLFRIVDYAANAAGGFVARHPPLSRFVNKQP